MDIVKKARAKLKKGVKQKSALPTRKLTVGSTIGPAVMVGASSYLGLELEIAGFLGALAAMGAGYFIRDVPNT